MTHFFTRLLVWALAACAGLAGTTPALAEPTAIATRAFSYTVTPVPGFVTPANQSWNATPPRGVNGVRYLLVDRQTSLADPSPRDFLRLAMQPTDAQAVQKVAQLYVEFNPEYQSLELHSVRVIRDGRSTDRTGEVKFELLQRETKLEQQLYDGEVAAVAILPDIRVNDIIVFERSVVGDNPIFQGRYSRMFPVHGATVTDAYRYRMIYPERRAIQVRKPGFLRETRDAVAGMVTLTLGADRVQPTSDDPDRPRWFDPQEWIEISEYADWRDVGRWAEGLFQAPGGLAPELRQQVESWRARSLDKPELTVEALRWVQREIRYFGVEIGVNSHRPAHPNTTFQRRFGDCKDKSLLLATLLNTLGIEARPALVSLDRNRGVEALLPGPHVFDHAIVRAVVDGKTYWLDATLPAQFGGLDEIGAYDYGKALVIGGGSDGLADAGYPRDYVNLYEVTDRFVVKDYKQPAELVSELNLSRSGAERFRALRANLPHEEFDRIFHSDYLRLFPSAEVIGAVEIRDDQAHNRFTMVRRYRIPELFSYQNGRFEFNANSPLALELLRSPEVVRRATPYDLPYPLEARIGQEVELPENPVREVPPPNLERTPYFSVRSSFKNEGKTLRRDLRIEVLKDHVPTKSMLSYVEDTQKLRHRAGITLTLRVGLLTAEDKHFLDLRLRRFDRYGKSRSGALNAQIDAEIGSRQITRDIESGKLTPRQLARAYADRAVHYDELDDVERALPDIDRAIEMDTGEVEYALTKGRILANNGRFEEARKLFERLDKEGHGHDMKESDLGSLGRAYLYLGDFEAAARSFEQAAQAGDREGSLIETFWQHLAAQRSHGRVRSQLESRLAEETKRDWPYPVGEMLLGRVSPKQLLDAAESDDKGIERDQLAEANFYLAQKFLLEEDKAKAGGYLETCVELDVTPFIEQRLAKIELKQIGERPKGFLKWLKGL